MARYKHYDYSQARLLPVRFEEQILPGTFEHTLASVIDGRIDLSVFEARYRNDAVGAPAYDPGILLKVILFAYSKGVTSSREIERLCRENVVFMALSADSRPHFTTIAGFIARLDAEIVSVFRDVLLVCDELGLIGREMFAVDGVKLPSNASKEWSGTRADFEKKAQKMERAVERLMRRHREVDQKGEDAGVRAARERQIRTLETAVEKIRGFLRRGEDRVGPSGRVKKSNLSDPESAKMKTSKGVIQGYTAVAVVDAKNQVVVGAEAFGEGQEHALLIPVLERTRATFREIKGEGDILRGAILTADAGFCAEANLEHLERSEVDGYVADTLFRKRDPRFAEAKRHRPEERADPDRRFRPADFVFDETARSCICPAGKQLYANGANVVIRGLRGMKFRGAKRDCSPCQLRQRCLKDPQRTAVRQVVFFLGREKARPENCSARMKRKIDTEYGRYQYGRRLGTVEPVFANICHAHGLRRFGLRTKRKVDIQWLLYCMVHNLGKVSRYGRAAQPE
ncbi:MAG: IS1182 family transposase [Burkholderiales bacterium]|nr:IS1182 family transposase [Burkholderiales bacterium]